MREKSYITNDIKDYKIDKIRGEADDVNDAMDSEDESKLNALGLPREIHEA